MSFKDILKNSFLENYAQTQMDAKTIIISMAVTCAIAVYIYCFYRIVTKKGFYSKSFNIALAALSIITAAIILTIQTSVVVSLGMVGALSIVRFRTAIKEPMDLVFLFWSISTGIICGARIYGLAIALALCITIIVLALDLIPQAKAPQILLLSYSAEGDTEDTIEKTIRESTGNCDEKSRTIVNGLVSLAYELRTSDGKELCKKLSSIDGITSVSLLKHDGEVTY